MRSLGFVWVFAATGCAIVDPWEPQLVEDQGQACLVTDPSANVFDVADQTYDATTPIEVQVLFTGICLSSSCSRNDEASCTVSVSGNDVTIEATAAWEQNVGPAACTDDCGMMAPTCSLGTLPDGTYTVTYGDASMTLTVPGTQAPCLGE